MKSRAPTAEELVAVSRVLAPFGVAASDLQPRTASLKAGDCLLTPGDSADLGGVVLRGVVREYYLLDDGTERTRGFSRAGDSIGSLSDVLAGHPARIFLRAVTATTVLIVPWSQIDALAKASLAWERMRYQMVVRLYLRKAAREYELLALDAAGRYRSFVEQYPGIENEISQILVASYLGITPVHLSRLKKRLRLSAPGRIKAKRAGAKPRQ